MKIVAVSGVGDIPVSDANRMALGGTLVAWAALLTVAGVIFWATLKPPRRS